MPRPESTPLHRVIDAAHRRSRAATDAPDEARGGGADAPDLWVDALEAALEATGLAQEGDISPRDLAALARHIRNDPDLHAEVLEGHGEEFARARPSAPRQGRYERRRVADRQGGDAVGQADAFVFATEESGPVADALSGAPL
ncbi:MAG: hypothetical protein AAF390_12580 [Pseudomonadota bacterium]